MTQGKLTQGQLIESNLTPYFQCLRAPCEVGTGVHPTRYGKLGEYAKLLKSDAQDAQEHPTRLYWRPNKTGQAGTYDPWEMRGQFLRIKEGDDKSLIEFLQTVGLFKSPETAGDPRESADLITGPDGLHYDVRYIAEEEIANIWDTRRLIEGSLSALNKHTGNQIDFTARITQVKGESRITITTCTFLESLLLTLAVDKARKAKVRKCARADCKSLFSSVSAHGRKFCCWYCGHIESVRNQRRDAKRAQRSPSTERVSNSPRNTQTNARKKKSGRKAVKPTKVL